MKYFIVEGCIKNEQAMTDEILKDHMAYSQKAIDEGLILMSGLKEDRSGGVSIMKAESLERVETYLDLEPLGLNGIQEYHITQFSAHYINKWSENWF